MFEALSYEESKKKAANVHLQDRVVTLLAASDDTRGTVAPIWASSSGSPVGSDLGA